MVGWLGSALNAKLFERLTRFSVEIQAAITIKRSGFWEPSSIELLVSQTNGMMGWEAPRRFTRKIVGANSYVR